MFLSDNEGAGGGTGGESSSKNFKIINKINQDDTDIY